MIVYLWYALQFTFDIKYFNYNFANENSESLVFFNRAFFANKTNAFTIIEFCLNMYFLLSLFRFDNYNKII